MIEGSIPIRYVLCEFQKYKNGYCSHCVLNTSAPRPCSRRYSEAPRNRLAAGVPGSARQTAATFNPQSTRRTVAAAAASTRLLWLFTIQEESTAAALNAAIGTK